MTFFPPSLGESFAAVAFAVFSDASRSSVDCRICACAVEGSPRVAGWILSIVSETPLIAPQMLLAYF